ncbi:MAG: hypothetical protein ACTSPD_10290 [Promethearchaeota archaeon]
MKIQIRDLVGMKKSLQKLAEQDLPIAISYELQKIVQIYNQEISIYSKQKTKIINKYADIKDGKRVIPPKKIPAYTKEVEQLLDLSVKFPVKKIKLSVLKAQNVKLSTVDLLNLEPIIENK